MNENIRTSFVSAPDPTSGVAKQCSAVRFTLLATGLAWPPEGQVCSPSFAFVSAPEPTSGVAKQCSAVRFTLLATGLAWPPDGASVSTIFRITLVRWGLASYEKAAGTVFSQDLSPLAAEGCTMSLAVLVRYSGETAVSAPRGSAGPASRQCPLSPRSMGLSKLREGSRHCVQQGP